jgi:hypothetical protein
VGVDDVLVALKAQLLRQRRPRRHLLPLAEAQAEAGGLAEAALRGGAGVLAPDVAHAQGDGPSDGARAAAGGAPHAAVPVLDAGAIA